MIEEKGDIDKMRRKDRKIGTVAEDEGGGCERGAIEKEENKKRKI